MKALLYIRLLAKNQTMAYGNPVLEQVKRLFPDVAALDVDSQSGELVLHYATQLLQNSEQTIVCIDSAAPDEGFGSLFPVLELALEGQKEQLILFRNSHTRLRRMVEARPALQMKQVENDEELLQEVKGFYSLK